MVLVGLRDPAESSMDRSEVVRMMQEMEWAAYFDFVVGARAIAGTEGGVPECVVNGIPASLGLNAKVRLLMTLAAALAQHGDDAAAQTVLWAALNDAAMAGQAEVLRTAVGAGPVFAAAGGPDLLVRLHEELVKESNMSVFDQRGQRGGRYQLRQRG